ncbi:MAG TPA: DNA adenine methylase [Verrucomicrobiae bacterium]|jgi:DNA adenine methylase|nr:DNA adenine methylase [Verrucomicrobiae bacterium]
MSPPRNPALRYYGAKFRLGRWIASNFPPHITYVEPFGGAAGVLLRKEPSPVEVYNDLDSGVVNFFRVLREQPQALFRSVDRTPFAREEFDQAFEYHPNPLEDARRFFVSSWQGFGGSRHKSTGWKIQRGLWEKSRANQLQEWHSAKRNLVRVAWRLRDVQIEHADALDVIRRFDTEQTLFYVDPPYPTDTRNVSWCKGAYAFEYSMADHTHLANLLCRIKGMAIVSTYPNPFYDQAFAGWVKLSTTSQTMNKTVATELIYLSPRAAEL